MQKTTYLITGWNTERTEKIKQKLISLGIDEKYIFRLNERQSRSVVLNKYFDKFTTSYVGLIDDDVNFSNNCPKDLEQLLDNTGRKRFLLVAPESLGDLFNITGLFESFKRVK